VVFVRHGLPGELVRVAVTESTSKFSRGDAVEVLEAVPVESFHRVVTPTRSCGGCDLQDASAEEQISWKSSLVTEHLRRIAGVEHEISVTQPASEPQGSRTRLRCAVDDGRLSLRAARSHDWSPSTPVG